MSSFIGRANAQNDPLVGQLKGGVFTDMAPPRNKVLRVISTKLFRSDTFEL